MEISLWFVEAGVNFHEPWFLSTSGLENQAGGDFLVAE